MVCRYFAKRQGFYTVLMKTLMNNVQKLIFAKKNGRLLATHSFTNSIYHTTLLKLQRNLVLILQLQGFALPCFSGQTFYKFPYYSTKTHNAPTLLKLSVSYLSRDILSFFQISVAPSYDCAMESLTFYTSFNQWHQSLDFWLVYCFGWLKEV